MALLYEAETYAILGACYEVYGEKGCGFLEGVYQECLALEFALRGIPFEAEPAVPLSYKGQPLEHTYRPDFICYGKIVVELKAVTLLADGHRAQLHNYLRAGNYRLGLLANFGHHPQLERERVIR
jgi:GxxExxY protein